MLLTPVVRPGTQLYSGIVIVLNKICRCYVQLTPKTSHIFEDNGSRNPKGGCTRNRNHLFNIYIYIYICIYIYIHMCVQKCQFVHIWYSICPVAIATRGGCVDPH